MHFPIALLALTLAQSPPVERSYDKIRDVTEARTVLPQIGKATEDLGVMLFRITPGVVIRPSLGPDPIELVFFSHSDHWRFIKHGDVHFVASGKQTTGKRAKHSGGLAYSSAVTEMGTTVLTLDQLQEVTAGDDLKILLGSSEFVLAPANIRLIRRFVAEVKLDQAGVVASNDEQKQVERSKLEAEQRQAQFRFQLERSQAEAMFGVAPGSTGGAVGGSRNRTAWPDKAAWEAKVAEVYPVALKALTEARNRASQASKANRQARFIQLREKAATQLCDAYDITRADLNQIMVEGEEMKRAMRRSEDALKAKDARKAEELKKAEQTEDTKKRLATAE